MLNVVLYQPEIPPNTGNVIRLCANTGARLHLVRPLGFELDDRHLRRSGLDYHDLAEVRVHATLGDCIAALAGARLIAVETGTAQRYSDVRYRTNDALLFGPETRGLPAGVIGEIDREHRVSIPMRNNNRSLNLANAVALVVYEAWRQLQFV